MRDALNEGLSARNHIFFRESSSFCSIIALSFPSLSSLLFRCAATQLNPNNL